MNVRPWPTVLHIPFQVFVVQQEMNALTSLIADINWFSVFGVGVDPDAEAIARMWRTREACRAELHDRGESCDRRAPPHRRQRGADPSDGRADVPRRTAGGT